jgi:poly(hydroxyalkanoate) polymerase-like protein
MTVHAALLAAAAPRLVGPARADETAAEQAARLDALVVDAAQGGSHRSADPAWTQSALPRRIVQAYFAAGRRADQLIDAAALDSRAEKRARFGVEPLIEALCPGNPPLVNPAWAIASLHTSGWC